MRVTAPFRQLTFVRVAPLMLLSTILLRYLPLLLTVLHFGGCSTSLPSLGQDAISISREVVATEDLFRGTLRYQGPEVKSESGPDSGFTDVETFSIRASQDRGRPVRFFIDVIDYYDGDWRGFDQVYDLEGNRFHALSTRHAVDCTILCGYEEILEIEIPHEYLESHAETGMTMRLYGPAQTTSAPFVISADYVQGFLMGTFDTGEASNASATSPHLRQFDSSHAAP